MTEQFTESNLPQAEIDHISDIILLIIRAGSKDSLWWWEDESLSEAGSFVLAKVFPRNPHRAAIRLAFFAAKQRHNTLISSTGIRNAVTLFDLTEGLILSKDQLAPHLNGPITSPDEFRCKLMNLAPRVDKVPLPDADASGFLDLTQLVNGANQSIVDQLTILAAGYLKAQKGKLVLPFTRLAEKESL